MHLLGMIFLLYQIMTSPQMVYLETCLTVSIHHEDETEVYVNFTCTQKPGSMYSTCWKALVALEHAHVILVRHVLTDKMEQVLCSIV